MKYVLIDVETGLRINEEEEFTVAVTAPEGQVCVEIEDTVPDVPLSWYELRKVRYPRIGQQLDDLFKQGLFSTEMAAKIQDVKDEFPKS